jgi:hypothetical protein
MESYIIVRMERKGVFRNVQEFGNFRAERKILP